MSGVKLNISLDNPHNVYFSGSTITGKLLAVCSRASAAEGLTIQFVGKAMTKTSKEYETTGINYDTNRLETWTTTKYYTEERDYVNSCITLFRPNSGILAPGSYTYPFQFDIPVDVPCSFSGEKGKVRYFIRYRTRTSGWQNSNYSKSDANCLGIVVLSLHDLNQISRAREKMTLSVSRDLGVWSPSAIVSAEFNIPRRGYVPGEVIPISGFISNGSPRKIEAVEIKLLQTVWYNAKNNTEHTRNTYSTVRKSGVPAKTTVEWKNVPYIVPALPPSNFQHCDMIGPSYRLNIVLRIQGFMNDILIRDSHIHEIFIGNVPLKVAEETTDKPGQETEGINAVKYEPEPREKKSWSDKISQVFKADYGKESCVPRYPVFDLKRNSELIDQQFEII